MNYLALTIGPIYETINKSTKTRELWAGSYIFSYFMKNLIKKLLEDKRVAIEFLVPYVNEKIVNKSFEVGIFHDRFVAHSLCTKDELETVFLDNFNTTIKEITAIIYDSGSSQENNIYIFDDIQRALLEYLQYNYIIASDDELNSISSDNLLITIDKIFDSMELQYSFTLNNGAKVYPRKSYDDNGTITTNNYQKINPIARLQFYAQSLKNIVINDHKDDDRSMILKFKSIPEIAVANLLEQSVEKEEIKVALEEMEVKGINAYESFYKILKEHHHSKLKPHHKYYAAISADGDRIGELIEETCEHDISKITNISQGIYRFITDEPLVGLFEEYGGMLVYAGGDDLLAFAPIFGKNGKTIFDLMEEISRRFKQHLGDEVSISFGVSIQYYKSPMIESINHSIEMLKKAKDNNQTDENININSGSVALSLHKHSGQSHDAVFLLLDNIYLGYKTLFVCELCRIIELPHSIHYSLVNYKKYIIKRFSGTHDGNIDLKIDTLFKNIIEDNTHSKMAKRGLRRLKKYIKILRPKSVESFDTFIAQLAIVKFLRGDE